MNSSFRPYLFCFMTGLFWFSQYTYVPVLSPYAQSLGASYKMVGIILGSYGLMQMLIRIPLGVWSDKLRKRKIFVILGVLFSIVSSLGVWFAQSVPSLLFFRTLSGISASTWVVFTVLFSSYFKGPEAPKAIGILNSFNFAGQMTAMFLGGIVAKSFGPEYSFLLGGIGGIFALALSFGIVERQDVLRTPVSLKELLETIKDYNLLVVSFLAVLSQLLTYATILGFTPIAAKQIGADSFQLGILTTLATLPSIFSSALGGTVFLKKVGEKRTVALGFILTALYCLSIPFTKQVELFYISQLVAGFGRGLVFSLLMGLSIKSIAFEKRATAMGFFQAVYGLGMFLGPMLVGFFGDSIGLDSSFFALTVVGAAGALISVLAIREVKVITESNK